MTSREDKDHESARSVFRIVLRILEEKTKPGKTRRFDWDIIYKKSLEGSPVASYDADNPRINRLVYQMLKDEGYIEDTDKPGEIKFTCKDTG
jgi:hypothetical protein